MLGRNIGLISCALGASAFLLPPGVSNSPHFDVEVFPLTEIDARSRTIKLPCSSCAFPAARPEVEIDGKESDLFWAQGGANNLVLNWTVSEDGQVLLLNDQPIYPPEYTVDALKDAKWIVEQVPAAATQEQLSSGDYLTTPLRITEQMIESEITGMRVRLGLQILSLENQPMSLDKVMVEMIRADDGPLLLLTVDVVPGFSMDSIFPPPGQETEMFHPQGKCNMPGPLCDIAHFLGSKVGALKKGGCKGKKLDSFDGHMPGHSKPHSGEDEHHHGRPGSHGHHRHHRQGVFHKISKALLAVLVPAMAGIAVGMVVGVLGLLTGRFIGWMWFKVIRGGKRGYARVPTNDIVITVTDMDKTAELEEQFEELPKYEDAPAYEQTEKEST